MTFNTITIPAQGESRPEGRGALAAYAYQQIRDQLIYCRYQGGERLVLRPLAASLASQPLCVRPCYALYPSRHWCWMSAIRRVSR